MDPDYLSRVLMRLRPFVRDGVIRRTRVERVLGTLQVPADTIRSEIERLLAKAGITIEEDSPGPTDTEPTAASQPSTAATRAGDASGMALDEAPRGEPRVIASAEVDHAVAAARRRIADDRMLTNHARVLLTAQQEVGLALLIRGRDGRPLDQGGFGRLTGEAREAAECLFLHNQRLIDSIAQRFPQTGMTYDDLVQHGCTGLIRAVEMFDPTQGNKFSTYATWWIRQSITRGVANDARLIRLPVYMVERLRNVWAKRTLLTIDGRPPSLRELARACALPEDAVMECLKLGPPDLSSLDMPIGDGEATLADVLDLKDSAMGPERVLYEASLKEQLQAVLKSLRKREAAIISLRFGLAGGDEKTLEEIGQLFGVTRERIRQIEKKTMEKLRHPSRSQVLRPYLFDSDHDPRTSDPAADEPSETSDGEASAET